MLLLITLLFLLFISKDKNIRLLLLIILSILFITTFHTYMTIVQKISAKKNDIYSSEISVIPNSKMIMWCKSPMKLNNAIESNDMCSISCETNTTGKMKIEVLKSSIEELYIEDIIVYYKYINEDGTSSKTEPIRLIYYESELNKPKIKQTNIQTNIQINKQSKELKQTTGNIIQSRMDDAEFTDKEYDENTLDKYYEKSIPKTEPKSTNRLLDRSYFSDPKDVSTFVDNDILSNYSDE